MGQTSKGDISITNFQGRIRLRWRYSGQRYSLNMPFPHTPENLHHATVIHQIYSTLKEFKNFIVTNFNFKPTRVFDGEFLTIELKPINPASLIELQSDLVDFDLYFIVRNSGRYMEPINAHNGSELRQQLYRIEVHFKNTFKQDKIIEKLLDGIKKARIQHRTDSNPMILLIDNEFLEDFSLPLLRYHEDYARSVQKYVNESESRNVIVILLYRTFNNKQPNIHHTVICRSEFDHVKRLMEHIDFRTINLKDLR